MAARGLSAKYVWRRRAAAAAVVLVVVIAGYYLWLRDSSVFAVDDVRVEGVTANQEQISATLEATAEGMSTLNINDEKLRATAAQFPTIASISADAGLLHSLTITVTERLPVGVAKSGAGTVAVSAEGFVLPGVEAEGLPPLGATAEGPQLEPEGIAQAAIAGGAPGELRDRIKAVAWDPDRGGVVVEMEGAPELRFGDGERAEEKWRAVATVLSAPELGSPAYLDASVPDRPVTGG